MKPTVPISIFLCLVTLASTADAQLFRNAPWNRVRTQSSCPGGICPTSNATRTVVRSANHWTYPGTIEGHLQSTHGVAVAGMSREQMLSMHDAIHEGRAVASPVTIQPVVYSTPLPKAAPQPKPVVQSLPSGSMFGLSSLESKTIPPHILAQVDEAKPVATDNFRKAMLAAVVDARKSGKITLRDAVKIRVASMSPAFVERAQDLAVTQMAFSGEESDAVKRDEDGMIEVASINWEGLAKFLEAFLPLLLSLLKAFGI